MTERTLKETQEALAKVSDIYARRFGIQRSDDWYLLKIQEELGELVAAYLKVSQRARTKTQEQAALRKNLEHELADTLAMTLLFAKNQRIDIDLALEEKWLHYLDEKLHS